MKRNRFIGVSDRVSNRAMIERLEYDIKVTLGGKDRHVSNCKIYETVKKSASNFDDVIYVRQATAQEIGIYNVLSSTIRYYKQAQERNG